MRIRQSVLLSLRAKIKYALKQTSSPIGVATYQLRNTLPENMKATLPELEEIARRLEIFDIICLESMQNSRLNGYEQKNEAVFSK
jgi:hypothetical protein